MLLPGNFDVYCRFLETHTVAPVFLCPGKNVNNQRDWVQESRILPDAALSMEGPWAG